MKKLFALALALVLVFSVCSTSSFAANVITDGSDSADVFGTFKPGSTAATVYSVDVSWGAMEFTYTSESEGAWDASSRTFSSITPATWTVNKTDGDKITVTNSSNASVDVSFSFAKSASTPNVTGSFTVGSAGAQGNSFTLATAVGTSGSDAPTDYARFVPGGSIDSGTGVKIGTITVTLS